MMITTKYQTKIRNGFILFNSLTPHFPPKGGDTKDRFMTKKELKDYLHLYLGCKMLIIKENVVVSCDTIKRTEKFPVWTTDENYCKPQRLCGHGFRYKEIKPILRPLSNANESEQHKLRMFETIPAGTDYLGVLKNEAERTLYLLQRHFDIFGLIEAGLAIDKTKL